MSSQARDIIHPFLIPDQRIAAVSVWLIIAGQISHHALSPLQQIETDSMHVPVQCGGKIPEGCISSESGGRRLKQRRIKQIVALWKKCGLLACLPLSPYGLQLIGFLRRTIYTYNLAGSVLIKLASCVSLDAKAQGTSNRSLYVTCDCVWIGLWEINISEWDSLPD